MASRSTDYDVILVGAGPAVCLPPSPLRKFQLRVLIIEKRQGAPSNAASGSRLPGMFQVQALRYSKRHRRAGLFSDGKLNFIYKLARPTSRSS